MKVNKWTIGLAAAGLVSLPSGAQSEEKASPLMTALSSTTIGGYVSSSVWWMPGGATPRPPAGVSFHSYLYTPSGWQGHACWWAHQFHIPNRHGFGNRGVYGRCPHGIIFLPARPRNPSGVFPGPLPPLPGRTRGTPGTNQIPTRIIRQPTLPTSSGLISMEASRISRGDRSRSVPPPLPPTLNTTPPQ
jgi:hypothetical protein